MDKDFDKCRFNDWTHEEINEIIEMIGESKVFQEKMKLREAKPAITIEVLIKPGYYMKNHQAPC